MIPIEAWRYMTARVREQYPDTLFFLEGLGGKLSVTRAILDTASFDWAYSELFQNYDRQQISAYLPEAAAVSAADGLMVHFAETHDNPRLAATSIDYARMRTALCALCSFNGAFAFANGVEWFATEKIDVHGSPALNWGAEPNQVAQIRRLNLLLGIHPAFHENVATRLVQTGTENVVVLRRRHRSSGKLLYVLANLDAEKPSRAHWPIPAASPGDTRFVDLLSGKAVVVKHAEQTYACDLSPGEVLCLADEEEDLGRLETALAQPATTPERIVRRQLRAKVLEVFACFKGLRDMSGYDHQAAARSLQQDPVAFCRALNADSDEPRVITWRWPADCRREVMLPPGHFLLVRAACAFRARIVHQRRTLATAASLPAADGSRFALIAPLQTPRRHRSVTLHMRVFTEDGCRHAEGPLRCLGQGEVTRMRLRRRRSALLQDRHIFLGTDGRGAMLRAAGVFGELYSRYDALLAANPNALLPEDRRIMLTRCRAWVVFQDYSQAVDRACLQSFLAGQRSRAEWLFDLPTGQGQHIVLEVGAQMLPEANRICLSFARHRAGKRSERLPDGFPVRLIIRPDIEDRNFHAVTKAYQGPEHHWPAAVHPRTDGFDFAPNAHRRLALRMRGGRFVPEPEWHYMVERPLESSRGLDPHSDLFSPGYLAADLNGGQTLVLEALMEAPPATAAAPPARRPPREAPDAESPSLQTALEGALDHYLVQREDLHTVVAGYPWFLDWGRDALIFARGLAATGRLAEARDILKLFGRFEQHGTLPNMIHGNDAANRDTSDAPLWWIMVCADIIRAEKSAELLNEPCGQRALAEVLASILEGYAGGTPNGIRMDPQSGLIFSPAHFTWMDTNHPAGTPRQGYPIEIESLWYAALQKAAELAPHHERLAAGADRWRRLADKVADAVTRYFVLAGDGYLSDCLQAQGLQTPKQALGDDALRPNQLFALTLEAVTDKALGRRILAACETLLIPGAVRSLADRPVALPLPIEHGGQLLGDPHQPYRGRYQGDEDTQRKPAYHNGTAWTWLLPCFCEAWVKVYGPRARATARAWLASSLPLVEGGCVGHVPEICDGDYPHTARGCDAQAWGASEWVRVWRMLEDG
jgi:glycogen debranching enzyme